MASDAHDPESQCVLGAYYLGNYYSTEPTTYGDHIRGFHLLEEAAEGGFPAAQLLIGMYYYEGELVEFNDSTGLYWLLEACKDDGEVGKAAKDYIDNIFRDMTSGQLKIKVRKDCYLAFLLPKPEV